MANIVLAHGLFGFNGIGIKGLYYKNYFNGVYDALKNQGHEVFVPVVDPIGTVNRRAEQLTLQVSDFCAEKKIPKRSLHFIGHSMGGLDVRQALFNDTYLAEHTKSLVTLGTPHKGSPVADAIAFGVPATRIIYNSLVDVFAESVAGLTDLTSKIGRDFDRKIKSNPDIHHFSIVGSNRNRGSSLLFQGIGSIIYSSNDGVVPYSSAMKANDGWRFLGQWPVDHAGLIGYFDFDPGKILFQQHLNRYIALAKFLEDL